MEGKTIELLWTHTCAKWEFIFLHVLGDGYSNLPIHRKMTEPWLFLSNSANDRQLIIGRTGMQIQLSAIRLVLFYFWLPIMPEVKSLEHKTHSKSLWLIFVAYCSSQEARVRGPEVDERSKREASWWPQAFPLILSYSSWDRLYPEKF